ncbi:hypothetical protein O181_016161 [Austropuccinia psidii MF-1]|uniref:Uncharacterized protein n=1 Tax=Austropuccinia psidii MF-1 TaxID=1389203 RepID=A0A9Q3C165_9BASI|nr:hypothetical protein [Austropuccinia psidii MF-1]
MYYNGNADYFDQDSDDENHLRNLVAILFIENSTDHNVFDLITSPMQKLNSWHIYQAMKKRFNKTSWSSIVHHARTILNTTDQLDNIDKYAIARIEHQIGKLDSENIATFAIYFSVPSLHDHIIAALNMRLVTNPHLKIHTNDLLDMIRQINTASPSFYHSTNLACINASFPGKKPKKDGKKPRLASEPRITPTNHDNSGKKKKTFDPSRPCYYCGKIRTLDPNLSKQNKGQ